MTVCTLWKANPSRGTETSISLFHFGRCRLLLKRYGNCFVGQFPNFSQLFMLFTGWRKRLFCRMSLSNLSQRVGKSSVVPPGGTEIIEGSANMFYDNAETVFYNKVQVFNRDMSIQVIKLFAETLVSERSAVYEQKKTKYLEHSVKSKEVGASGHVVPPPRAPRSSISILDALAASGLRSIRYLKEIPLVEKVTINDISEAATKLAFDNCVRNSVDMNRVEISLQDATVLMYQHRDPSLQFDVIDLDPYGSAVNFLDAAVQSVADGGLLCVTCTDMTVLSGNYPEVCFAKYSSMPMPVHGKYVHEMSLRVLLHSIDITANKYRRYIVPWISLSVDFYVRVFVRVFESPQEVKNSCLKRCMLFQSLNTPSFYIHPLAHCNAKNNYNPCVVKIPSLKNDFNSSKDEKSLENDADDDGSTGFKMGGPFWSAPIHKQEIADELLRRAKYYEREATEQEKRLHPMDTIKRILGMLTLISEEVKEAPFHYNLPDLASTVRCQVPVYKDVKTALNNLGYKVSQFHHEPSALKTDAPNYVVRT
jgi:tRNA (guanine26-N2/guanine27-N2)-dimethyltransferase